MYKKILAPLDGSKLSECSLEHVKAIATGCQASAVVLLAVLEPVKPPYLEITNQRQAEEMARELQKAERETAQKAEDYLAGAAGRLKKEGIPVQTVVAPSKAGIGAAEGILDYAGNNNVDLIIMSTHGRSGVSRWAFGSVADKVVRHAKVPVMTVAPSGCR